MANCIFMGCFLICATCCIVGVLSLLEEDWKSISICFVSIIICAITMISLEKFKPEQTMQYDYQYNIYALEDNMKIRGSRFYIEQDFKYYYLAEYKDGKKMYCVSKDNSYIKEDDKQTPHIEVFTSKFDSKSKFVRWLYDGVDVQKEYKIVVPEQTCIDEFNVDMKE